MKKILSIGIVLFSLIAGCSKAVTVKNTYDKGYKTYYEMSDGTWKCDDYSYKYRLEISGRLPNAVEDFTFVYLSNMKDISFEQALKAAGLSSFSGDYFSPEDAVFVEFKQSDNF